MYIDSWDNKAQYFMIAVSIISYDLIIRLIWCILIPGTTKYNTLWLQCQASNHPSDNQHSEMHNLFQENISPL